MQLGFYHNQDARPSADQTDEWHCPACLIPKFQILPEVTCVFGVDDKSKHKSLRRVDTSGHQGKALN